MRIGFLLIASMLITSCARDVVNKDAMIVDVPLEQSAKEVGLSQIADSLSYVFLETNDQSIIGSIDRLIVAKNHFVVVDKEKTKSVFVFDRGGNFVSKIHRVGRSAEEYLSITDVAIDELNERIFIVDCKFKKLLEYNFNGEFIKKSVFKPIVSSIAYTGGGRIAAYCGFAKNERLVKRGKYPNLIIVDVETAEVTKEYLYFDDAIADSNVVGMISNFTQGDNSATLAMPLDNTIYTIRGEELVPKLTFNFPFNQETKLKRYINKTKNGQLSAMQATELFDNSDMAYLMNCISTVNNTYLFYKYKNIYYYGFYNAGAGRYIESSREVTDRSGTMIPVYNDIDSTFRFMPIAGRGTRLYYTIEPAYVELFKHNAATIYLKQNIDMNSNPIIASVDLI